MSSAGPVVVVEDDLDDQEIFTEIFTELQFNNPIIFFQGGQAVLDYLKTTSDKPFIIITDINLSGMDGIQLRSEICKDDYLRQKSIPFVFLTTSDGKHILQKVYGMQVQGFFQKKSTYEAIKRQIKLIIDYWQECRHPNIWLGYVDKGCNWGHFICLGYIQGKVLNILFTEQEGANQIVVPVEGLWDTSPGTRLRLCLHSR